MEKPSPAEDLKANSLQLVQPMESDDFWDIPYFTTVGAVGS